MAGSGGRDEAIYVDLQDGQGWVRDINLQSRTPFTRDRTPMKLRADWLRHSADGSYTAVGAVATTCEHEVPHYVIRIGDLRITPRSEERVARDPATGEEVTEEMKQAYKQTADRELSYKEPDEVTAAFHGDLVDLAHRVRGLAGAGPKGTEIVLAPQVLRCLVHRPGIERLAHPAGPGVLQCGPDPAVQDPVAVAPRKGAETRMEPVVHRPDP